MEPKKNQRMDAFNKIRGFCREFFLTIIRLNDALVNGGRRNQWGERVFAKLRRDGFMPTILTVARIPFTLKYRVAYRKMLKRDTLQQRFREIYEKNFWGSSESGSGEGSELEYTERLRSWLGEALPKYGIKKVVDAACGDFNWMRMVIPEVDADYYGFDIVESVVQNNNRKYAGGRVNFEVLNICEDKLPDCDLLVVRDCLFHFSNHEINKFIQNIRSVNYKYLLTTTHIVDEKFINKDIVTGDFRIIDLFKKPFFFEKKSVIEWVDDYPVGYPIPRQMVMIAKPDVPKMIKISI